MGHGLLVVPESPKEVVALADGQDVPLLGCRVPIEETGGKKARLRSLWKRQIAERRARLKTCSQHRGNSLRKTPVADFGDIVFDTN